MRKRHMMIVCRAARRKNKVNNNDHFDRITSILICTIAAVGSIGMIYAVVVSCPLWK